jgi:signal transduction histidine kinase
LCLWDIHPCDLPLAQVEDDLSRHLFVVNRNEVAEFQEKILMRGARVLLKPLTRATFELFLTQAIAPFEQSTMPAKTLHEERDEMLQYLIQTNLKLQQYDQDRTTFLAKAVHDFRAPLTALSGYCGLLLLSGPLGPLSEGQKEVLRRMQHSTKRLSRMANAMFQLSVGRHVVRKPDLASGDLRECLEQALHEIAPFAGDRCITIRTDLGPCDGLQFEGGQMEQALINILDNACKFSPKAGLIEILGYPFFWERRTNECSVPGGAERRRTAATEPNSYRVDIQDSGTPIPDEFLERIFEEYTSYGGGRDRSGGGLGLPITRMIVSQHEGMVWAENTSSGPRISFVLPLSRHSPSQIEQLGKTA